MTPEQETKPADARSREAAVAAELLPMLQAELPGHRERMRSALAVENWEDLRFHVHRLHGAAAYCHLEALRAETKAVERAVAAQDYAEVYERVPALERLIDEVLGGVPG